MVVITDDKPDVTPNEHHPDHSQPPAYPGVAGTGNAPPSPPEPRPSSPSTSGPPPPSANFAPLTRPTNYLTIERENSSINGTYSIDPTLPAPPGAVKSQDRDGKDLNVKMFCKSGWLSAVIDIVRGADAKGPARLETIIEHGTMGITLYDRQQNRFHLRASVQHSTATIRIPPTFVGSITTNTQHSTFRFDSSVQRHLTTISEVQNEGRYFIGDFAVHGYQDQESWHMDHLDIEVNHSTVTIKFSTDQASDDRSSGVKGFFSRWFSS